MQHRIVGTTMPVLEMSLQPNEMVFAESGELLATLTGPGRVWLQSLTLPHLAHAIAEYLPRASG